MIIVQNLSFVYPALHAQLIPSPLFQDVSFEVLPGQALAIMGASGLGKSTLCYILAGLAPRYTGGKISGDVHIVGYDVVKTLPPIGTVGVLFQDAATQLFNDTVENEIAWGLEAKGLAPSKIEPSVEAALARFGLRTLRHRPPWTLSGGEQKRLALAAIWAMRPRVLLLDEPLGGLDPAGRTEALAALETLRDEGTTFLISTLRPRTATLASKVMLFDNKAILSAPESTSIVLTHDEKLVSRGICLPPEYWPDFGETELDTSSPVITLDNVYFKYPDGDEVLSKVDLHIPQGQFVAIVGPNGAGKSTLVRHFNGLLKPTRGTVRVSGLVTSEHSIGDLAQRVSFLFQRPERQLFAATVYDEVAYGLRQLDLPDIPQRVAAILTRFALDSFANLPPSVLSYGIQRAVTLACLAALDTPIVILDEPSVGLDGHGWKQLLDWMVERRAAGVTLIVVTHEMALAARADRVIALDGGRVVADNVPDVVLPQLSSRSIA